jgi:hypothetical protein
MILIPNLLAAETKGTLPGSSCRLQAAGTKLTTQKVIVIQVVKSKY